MITFETILENPKALVGLISLALLLIVLFIWDRKDNQKKFRHRVEFGSARWGTKKEITPYVDPEFKNGIYISYDFE